MTSGGLQHKHRSRFCDALPPTATLDSAPETYRATHARLRS
jgi:hypothetical protein